MNMHFDEKMKHAQLVKPEVIEPQYRSNKKRFRCGDQIDIVDMEIAHEIKVNKDKSALFKEAENELFEPLKYSKKIETDESSDMDVTKVPEWNDIASYLLEKTVQHSIKSSEENFNLSLEKEDKENNSQDFVCNLHKYLVNYQENCGIPNTEYPFTALVQEMGQVTGQCFLALLYMLVSLIPIIQIFLSIARFVLDRLINIQGTTDSYQMFVKYVILGVQLLSVFIFIGLMFGFIVLPVLQMELAIASKILLYE